MGRGNYLNRGIFTSWQHIRGAEDALRIIRTLHPEISAAELQAIKAELKSSLPIFNADTAATLIPNLTTGRIANRLDLMGANFTVDAACASSLVAAEIGLRDLLTDKCDLVLAGGIYLSSDVAFQSIFCQLRALSRRSQIRPFDQDADGLLIGEGAGFIVLKRLQDAERDGNRIYAVIKGVGTSSDGRALSVLAPRVEGEELALRRAYEMAEVAPQTVQLVEAHGTATLVGDVAEVQAMARVFGPREGPLPWCGLGSIKSMIGHLMPAAGIAGLIKAALALHHKILPPTLHCERPNPRLELEKTPFYINTETRPWIHGTKEWPRRAGVNAFGFGGINAHVVLEEYQNTAEDALPSHLLHWDSEVCIFQGDTRPHLMEQMQHVQRYLEHSPAVSLKDLAYTLNIELKHPHRLAIVANSVSDLGAKLTRTLQRLSDPQRRQIKDRDGIYFFQDPLGPAGQLAFLFPGVGAAYVNMLADLCLHFPEVRHCFDLADQLFVPRTPAFPLPSQIIYPPPDPTGQASSQLHQRLWQEDGVLQAIFAADGALYVLLSRLGVQPAMMVGHSFGDFFPLFFAGATEGSEHVLVEAMRAFAENAMGTVRTYERLQSDGMIPQHLVLLNIGADSDTVSGLLHELDGPLYISMDNCPHQVVTVGERGAVQRLIELLKAKGIFYEELPLNQTAYHTPLFESARRVMEESRSGWMPPTHRVQVYSCTTASPYPEDKDAIRQLAIEHWWRRVEFRKTIEAMYAAGARIFVEVGPGGILTAFVDDILRGRLALAVACNVPRRSGLTQLNHLVGMLASQRVPLNLAYLYRRRSPQQLCFDVAADRASNAHSAAVIVDIAQLGAPSMKLSQQFLTAMSMSPRARTNPEQLGATPSASDMKRDGEPEQCLPTNGAPAQRAAIPEPTPSPSVVQADTQPISASGRQATERPPSGVLGQAMQGYLRTMNVFLETQQEIMHSVMARGRAITPPTQAPVEHSSQPREFRPTETPPMPFVGTIVSMIPAQEVVTQRQIHLAEDLFLHDHTFGGQVSSIDDTLEPLPVIPMTVAMEIMAETAALLMPGKVFIGMRDIQTYQWIDVENAAISLQITARRRTAAQHEVEVRVHTLGEEPEPHTGKGVLAMQGIIVFGAAYPAPPPVTPLSPTSPRRPEFTAEELYQEHLMFHGPRFQGVAALDWLAAEGLMGQLQVLPTHNLFRSTAQPRLLTDFALLDAAGQLVGYWPLEWAETGYNMFPIRLETLHVYGPLLAPGRKVVCQVRMHEVHEKYMRADIDIIRPDGQLWMRLLGWCDWRFYGPREAYDFFRFPREVMVSTPLPAALARFPSPGTFECLTAELGETFYSREAGAFWVKVWARLILNHQERREFASLGGAEQRQVDWLLARIAAKDAIRTILEKRHGLAVYPADIEIAQDAHGRPEPRGVWQQQIGYTPALSISQSSYLGLAIAGTCDAQQCLGVDVQRIEPRSQEFVEHAFTSHEHALLNHMEEPSRHEWLTRFWSAKEAVGKALGPGLPAPQSVMVTALDQPSGIIHVALAERFAAEFPDLAGASILTYTARHRDFIVASTLCERA